MSWVKRAISCRICLTPEIHAVQPMDNKKPGEVPRMSPDDRGAKRVVNYTAAYKTKIYMGARFELGEASDPVLSI